MKTPGIMTLPTPQINALMEKPPRCLATMKLSQKPDAKGKNWYAIDDKGVIHRFQGANGKMHWAGDTSQNGGLEGIDSYAQKRLDEIFKEGRAVSTRCP